MSIAITTNLLQAVAGEPFSAALTASGGVAPYSWSTQSILPGGPWEPVGGPLNLGLVITGGALAGTPGPGLEIYGFHIAIRVTDTVGATARGVLMLDILPGRSRAVGGQWVP
jgi:hypothetical protein